MQSNEFTSNETARKFISKDFKKNELQEKLTLCVVDRPYAFVTTKNGVTLFVFQNKFAKHSVIHLICEKWFCDNMKDPLSIIHECTCIELL